MIQNSWQVVTITGEFGTFETAVYCHEDRMARSTARKQLLEEHPGILEGSFPQDYKVRPLTAGDALTKYPIFTPAPAKRAAHISCSVLVTKLYDPHDVNSPGIRLTVTAHDLDDTAANRAYVESLAVDAGFQAAKRMIGEIESDASVTVVGFMPVLTDGTYEYKYGHMWATDEPDAARRVVE